jgi:hypothetical protein
VPTNDTILEGTKYLINQNWFFLFHSTVKIDVLILLSLKQFLSLIKYALNKNNVIPIKKE